MHHRLLELLRYNQNTGDFVWNVGLGRRRYGIAGTHKPKGHIDIQIDGVIYKAHRLAWFYIHGVWPRDQIDHINSDASDNRLVNLRECTNRQNCQNRSKQNRLGLKGVCSKGRAFIAQISVEGSTRHLGSFRTAEAAHSAYCDAARLYFGEFAKLSL